MTFKSAAQMPVHVRGEQRVGAGGPPLSRPRPPALLLGHSQNLGLIWGRAGRSWVEPVVTYLLGEKTPPSSPHTPHQPRPGPPHPPGGPGLTVGPWQSWGLEASASPGAWDPAELEQVGPIGQDLETERGAAPGTQEHRGPAQPARPVLQSHYQPLLLAGGSQRHHSRPHSRPSGGGGGRWG